MSDYVISIVSRKAIKTMESVNMNKVKNEKKAVLTVLIIVNMILFIAIVITVRKENSIKTENNSGKKNAVTASEKTTEKKTSTENKKKKKSSEKETAPAGYTENISSESSFTSVSYVVISRDADGNTLEKQMKQGTVGETVKEEAEPRNGYIVDDNQKSIVLSDNESENVIIFYYDKITVLAYTVQCVDEYGNLLSESTDYGETGSTVCIDAPYLEGYISLQEEQSIILSPDEDDNIVTFKYEEEKDITVDIPERNTCLYNGHTYYAYRTNSIDSFWEAEVYAEDRGGYLAIINDNAENQVLYEYVMDDLGYESAYFGLVDTNSVESNGWEWVDGSKVFYEHWAAGQPDREGIENYALFWYKDPRYTWNNADFGKDAAGTVTFLIEWDIQ